MPTYDDEVPNPDDPAHGLINPRLSDVFGMVIRQDEVDFVVPHLNEDLPLCLDPFLLWKADHTDYRELHSALLSFVSQVQTEALAGHTTLAHMLLSEIREPAELGLGYSEGTKQGSAIGPALRSAIVQTFREIPQLQDTGLDHIEVLALVVPNIAEDRLSDVTASVIKKWLAEFTKQRCNDFGIPTRRYRFNSWDPDRADWRPFDARLPYNPVDDSPVLLAPLDLLRRLPWINYDDYYKSTYSRLVLSANRSSHVVAKPRSTGQLGQAVSSLIAARGVFRGESGRRAPACSVNVCICP